VVDALDEARLEKTCIGSHFPGTSQVRVVLRTKNERSHLDHLEYTSRAQLGIIGADSSPDIQSQNCPNYGLQCQVVGRLWRLGQKEKVFWKILRTKSTFDHCLETKHMRAYVSTVEAEAAIDARITTSSRTLPSPEILCRQRQRKRCTETRWAIGFSTPTPEPVP
ncbi:hypothetical protein CCUS01_01225, partial [Colletotrichum cuscutae]